MPKKEDIIYLTGFFDGDGCITTCPKWNFRVTISNTDKNILNWIKKNFGGNINNQFYSENPKHNVAWKWVIAKRSDLLKYLEMIYPYLKIKNKQAKIVINHLKKYPALKGKEKYNNQRDRIKEEKEYFIAKEKVRKLKTDKHYFRGDK